MKYFGNGFSASMLINPNINIKMTALSKEELKNEIKGAKSCIGHQDLAEVLSNELDCTVAYNRTSIALGVDDVYYWAYLNGGRLPIGATRLPQNVDLKYVKLEFKEA
nr:MAG TPA: DNA binding protein [Caudoviricetes sp.]